MSTRKPGWLLRELDRQFGKVVRGPQDMWAYQTDLLVPFLLANPRSGAFVDMGLGKAQPIDAKVLTPTGWTQIGKIRPGDFVAGSSGGFTKVQGVYPQGRKPIFKVRFNDGSETRCCDEHLWSVNTPGRRFRGLPFRTFELSDIRATLADGQGNRQHFIPIAKPIVFAEAKLSVPPYLLGVLLGDGCIKYTVTLTSMQETLLDDVRELLPPGVWLRHAGGIGYRLSVQSGSGSNPLWRDLERLGLAGKGSDDKFIPPKYLLGSIQQRTDLLQGLLDTDGYASADGTIQFSSNSKLLADGVRELVQSLGGIARRSSKISASNKPHHLLTLAFPAEFEPFRVGHKKERYRPRVKYPPARAISEVTSDGEAECVCIEVRAPDHLYITDDYILTHNTVSVLTLLSMLIEGDKIGKVLIIAPLRVAVETWPTEIKLWSHTAWLSHSLIRGDPSGEEVATAMKAARVKAKNESLGSPSHAAGKAKTATLLMQRKRAARSSSSIHIINREAVEWLVEFHGKAWPYDTVVIDESTSFSDHKTGRWKALASCLGRISRLHILTGTPAPEGLMDLFAQIYLLDRGERFGKSISAFRRKYFTHDQYTRKYTPLDNAEREITRLIGDIVLVMKEEDYLDSTKPLVIERQVTMTSAELKVYKKFEREFVLDLPDGEIEALNAGALRQKLLQLASGAVYDAERRVHLVHNHKIEELQQLIEEAQGSPILVAYWFQSSLARLRKAFPQAVVMDKKAACVAPWNAGKIPILLLHPQSAGHGLNMQLGPGHILVFFDTPAGLEPYLQVIKRIARQGQKRLVRVYHLVTQDTLDATMVPRLVKKESAQASVIGRLQELRRGVA